MSSGPKRVQRKRTKGWKMSEQSDREVVYVGRPTKWGNGFKIWHYDSNKKDGKGKLDRDATVLAFRRLVEDSPEFCRIIKEELRGKDLACWCKESDSCHADVLLEIANKEELHGIEANSTAKTQR